MNSEKEKDTKSLVSVVSKIDFTKGFSSWHFQWPINGVLENPCTYTNEFQTVVDWEGKSAMFIWQLVFEDNGKKEPYAVGISFGLCLKPTNITNRRPIPVVYRLALEEPESRNLIYNVGHVCNDPLADEDELCGEIHMTKIESVIGKDIIMHCWLDIPNAIAGFLEKEEHEAVSEICTMPTAVSAALFNGVIGEAGNLDDLVMINIVAPRNNELIRQFKCHKYILASRSSVFRNMFTRSMSAEEQNGVREIAVDDIYESTMEKVLKYIYTNEFSSSYIIDNRAIDNIIFAANKYNLPELKGLLLCNKSLWLCMNAESKIQLAHRNQMNQ